MNSISMPEAYDGMYLGVSAPTTLVNEGVGVRRAERACGAVGAFVSKMGSIA